MSYADQTVFEGRAPSAMSGFWQRIFSFPSDIATAACCAREIEKTLALSDDRLARLGLKRDEIVPKIHAKFYPKG